MEEKTYARHLKATDGRLVARYTAIDPADRAIRCTCGKPECARARLRPFREHVAELYRVLGVGVQMTLDRQDTYTAFNRDRAALEQQLT